MVPDTATPTLLRAGQQRQRLQQVWWYKCARPRQYYLGYNSGALPQELWRDELCSRATRAANFASLAEKHQSVGGTGAAWICLGLAFATLPRILTRSLNADIVLGQAPHKVFLITTLPKHVFCSPAKRLGFQSLWLPRWRETTPGICIIGTLIGGPALETQPARISLPYITPFHNLLTIPYPTYPPFYLTYQPSGSATLGGRVDFVKVPWEHSSGSGEHGFSGGKRQRSWARESSELTAEQQCVFQGATSGAM